LSLRGRSSSCMGRRTRPISEFTIPAGWRSRALSCSTRFR
jgi:hypothetical protein